MPNINNALRRPAAGILAVLTLASLGLTACGGSSGKTSSAANAAVTSTASSSTPTTGSPTTGSSTTGSTTGSPTTSSSSQAKGAQARGNRRFTVIRECLQKNGITLPKPTTGTGGPQSRGVFPGARQLPKGVTRTQYQAALRKCLGGQLAAPGGSSFRSATNNPALMRAFTKFATCLRQNGINIPPPNTSGHGPIFSTKGINTASPQFKAATTKCRITLASAFHRPGAGGGGSAAGGAAGG